MIEELTRKMNAAERADLSRLVTDSQPLVTFRSTAKWCIVWSGGLVGCGSLIGAMVVAEINPIVSGILCGPVGILGIICLYAVLQLWSSYFHWSGVYRNFVRHDIPEIRSALDDGIVTVKKVAAIAVIEIVEFEDEGGGHIFDLGDGRLLFLKGQQYFPVSDEMSWPNSDFEIVRTQHGNRWVGIFCYGSELTPVRTIETSDCTEETAWAEREEVVEADLDSFATSLLVA